MVSRFLPQWVLSSSRIKMYAPPPDKFMSTPLENTINSWVRPWLNTINSWVRPWLNTINVFLNWLAYWLLWTVSRINQVQVWTFIKHVQYVQHVNYKICAIYKTCTVCTIYVHKSVRSAAKGFTSFKSFFVLWTFFIKNKQNLLKQNLHSEQANFYKNTLIFEYFLFVNLSKNKIVFRLILKYNFVCSQVAEISSTV